MPTVQVYLWEGRTEEQIREMIAGITDVFVKQGSKPQTVTVIMHEIPKNRWGKEGKPASEL